MRNGLVIGVEYTRYLSRPTVPSLVPSKIEEILTRRGLPGAVKRVKTVVNNAMYPATRREGTRYACDEAERAAGEHVIKRKLNGNTYGIAPIT